MLSFFSRTFLLTCIINLQKAEELWKATIKKFSQSSKVWTLFGMFYLQQNNVEGARELLQRSLQSLPKRKRKH
jgi:rRNA biogenesis protein RRP5